MAIGVLDSWQQRRMKGRLRAEARHLIKEAQRILKRKSFRIPQTVVGEVQGAVNS